MRAGLVFVAASAATGCLKDMTYQCTSPDQCVRDGAQGRCESNGLCSFSDPSCSTGQRFGNYAGSHANQCVGGNNGMVDAHGKIDGTGCPSGFAALPGVPSHLYDKLITAAGWSNHKTACESQGANVYLAIPDDMTELSALVTNAGQDVWVGIDDIAVEGTFVTVRNATPPFLPWAPGEPDNAGNQDCVEILAASSQVATLACSQSRIAICECEP
jgi:C-type mannose receptor